MWKQHDNYMKQLKQLYNKTSKQTQNRLQELFDTFNFISENIYNIADNKTKKRILGLYGSSIIFFFILSR